MLGARSGGILTGEDVDNIRNMLFDANAGGDVVFLVNAFAAYAAARLAIEFVLPGKLRGYTHQQYVVTLAHQVVVLPVLAVCWAAGLLASGGSASGGPSEAPGLIYLLTGAYVLSDSLVNYSPISAAIAGSAGPPTFSWGVHAHHGFTLLLCLLGTTLPPWLEVEGAVAILLGEAGSLWITITLLRPTRTNFLLRLLTFFASRLCAVPIAIDVLRQCESPLTFYPLLAGVAGLVYDNVRTLLRMRYHARQAAAGGGVAEHGSWPL
mmetsp:Transcript_7712/g.23880  ORF Transcript_7712/g.23880 Transcript_7712/m.23880 type:complete len:265 (-) Transcript_7712:290-1084(-)